MSRCALCPGTKTCVPPHGPWMTGRPLYIGEAPGYDENRKGIPFIGKTGMEVNQHYLPLAGQDRPGSMFTNAIKCLPEHNKGKLNMKKEADKSLLESCSSHFLYEEIEQLRPSVLVPMGAFACYAINPDIDLELHHGIPVETRWGIPAFPMWHPAGGIHEPKKMIQIRTDWIRLRRYLGGNLDIPQDEYPDPDYSEVTDTKEVREIDPTMLMACDTEYSRSQGPYCITYSQVPGTGRLIKADRGDLIHAFQKRLDMWENHILFHNYLYDWTVTEEMSLAFPFECIRDTMVTVYHLANLPQGLKVLAYRLLGMEMQSFEDLVKPHSTVEVLRYYKWAQALSWPKPEEQLVIDDTTGLWKLYKPQSFSTKLKTFFTNYNKKDEKDVFKMWDKNWVDYQEELEKRCGLYPGMDIIHAPDDEVLHYACRDADATLRLWPILQHMKDNAKLGMSQEQWELYV